MIRFSVGSRGLAALAAVIAAMLALAASAGAAQLAFVGNEGSHSVSVIDTATNTVVGEPIEVGKNPASIAVTPDGRFAYVDNDSSGSVSVIETSTRQTVGEPIKVGTGPYGIAITSDGSRAFVTDRGSDEVSVINTQTRQVIGAIHTPLGSAPAGVAVSPEGEFGYVTEAGADAVQFFNTATLATGEPIEVGEGPEGIELTPDGKTAYVVDDKGKEVTAIDTSTRQVTSFPLVGERPRGIVVSPDGTKAFVVDPGANVISEIDTATNRVSKEIPVGAEPQEVAITANGKTLYVTEASMPQVQRINVETGAVVGSTALSGEFPAGIAITPDQSPTAVFAAPSVTAGVPATFSGAASTDPGGLISSYSWSFGDGTCAFGPSVTHVYAQPGTYTAALSVVDNQGCGVEEVFTGRTAYCSGNPLAKAAHPVEVMVPPVVCSARQFRLGGVIQKRKSGTARLKVTLPAAGSLFLFGKKVHAVTRKSAKAGSTWLTIHARVEVNKRLKKIHRTSVKVRVTYTPSGSCGSPKTIHRSLALLRAPRKKHHHG